MAFDGKSDYSGYLRTEIARFETGAESRRYLAEEFLRETNGIDVLDVGCGAGQELLPFLERGAAVAIGIDVQTAAGEVFRGFFAEKGLGEHARFIQATGEGLPFAAGTFDLVICRVALPYMRTDEALREMARVMREDGMLILTIHTPYFYLRMIKERLGLFSPKQLFYPVACFAGGLWYMATGRQPVGAFWKGKENFHTRTMLRRELGLAGLSVERELVADGKGGRTFVIVKT